MTLANNTESLSAGYVPYHNTAPHSLLLPAAVRAALFAERVAQAKAQQVEFAEVEETEEITEEMAAAKADADHAHAQYLARCIPVFNAEQTNNMLCRAMRESDDKSQRSIPTFEAALVDKGLRALITQPCATIVANVQRLGADMPNFRAASDLLCAELALAMASCPSDFRVTCLCLNGPPGIGKTRFAKELARILDVGFEQISLGAIQGGFELAGVAAGWTNTRPGRLVKLLAEGKSACPVVLLDELDKTAGDERFSPLAVLLDLLEKDTAVRFRDECLEIRFDASKMIFIATSNDADLIPEALKSRMRIVEVLAPTAEQRRQIIDNITVDFTNLGIKFSPSVIDALCDLDLDLRSMSRFVREIAGKTLVSGKDIATLDDLPALEKKQAMGFV